MNLPSGAQCCRLARYRLRPLCDHIQIPESLLSTIPLDRSCTTVGTIIRHGSSVPGPMENRRRIGKRHMGELNFGHSYSPPPLWELENLADLTKWKWKPPSKPDDVLRPHTAAGRFLANLQQVIFPSSDLDEGVSKEMDHPKDPTLPPDTVLSAVAEGELLVEPTSSLVEFPELPVPEWHAQSTSSDIIADGLHLLLSDLAVDFARVSAMPNLAKFCASWRNGLADGLFGGQTFCLVMKGIQEGLDAQAEIIDERTKVETMKCHLFDATIEGVFRREQKDPKRFDYTVWSNILQGVSNIKQNNLRIFQRAMDCIPDSRLDSMSAEIIANLEVIVQGLGRSKKGPTLARQAVKIVTALARLGESSCKNIMSTITYRLLLYSRSYGTDYALCRFGLLHVLARQPGSDRELAGACLLLESSPDSGPLSSKEICHIFVARRNSRSLLNQATSVYDSIRSAGKYTYIRHLGRSFWKTRQYHHAKSMAKFLHYLGRDDCLVQLVKGARGHMTREISSLANIASRVGKPSIAIELLTMFDRCGRSTERFWRSKSSSIFLQNIIEIQGLNHKKFLKTMNITSIPREKRVQKLIARHRRWALKLKLNAVKRTRPLKPVISIKQILKTTRAAMALARSPALTRTKALALIGECVKYLKTWDAAIPPSVIWAIIHNVTRDLAEGRPGRSLRLRYLLHLLREEFGDKTMLQTGKSLKRWRDMNFRNTKDHRFPRR